MAVEIVTSWRTLFQLARAEGQARRTYECAPTDEARSALEAATAEHEAYRRMCLKADRMIHQPDLS